jgi:hypothetical protein
MRSGYRISDYLHFGGMLWRHRARQKRWRREYETAVAGGSFRLPFASNVTLIPTETCNLRCPMCNQWGEEGYFLRGAREAQHMDEEGLRRLIQGLDPSKTLLSIHGGEPFGYRHIQTLLQIAGARAFDVLITTNGTLMEKHLEPLARVRNLSFSSQSTVTKRPTTAFGAGTSSVRPTRCRRFSSFAGDFVFPCPWW